MADDLSRLQGGLGAARWIDPEDFHLTLRFIGDVGERAANDIADMLYAVRKRTIEVTLTGLGSFGGDKPRSLYIAVKQTQP
ncbi:2'-5' RNA ligase family protein, partial [Acinetobacter baumannii]